MAKTNVLLLGATGFIGGTILDRLLQHPDASRFEITLLVRSAEKAAKFDSLKLGVKPVVGGTEDPGVLQGLAAQTDVLIVAVPAQHPHVINNSLPGLKERYAKTGKTTRLLCVGGTSITGDGARGLHASDKVWSDLDPSVLFDPPTPFMKFVSFLPKALVEANSEGYVKTYLISPPLVYGEVDNRFVKAGLQNAHCWAWDLYVKPALARGKAGFVGQGLNSYGSVHVEDFVDLFLLIFNTESTSPHGKVGFYYANPTESTCLELARAIGEGLVALGKAKDPTPAAYTEEEIAKYLPPYMGDILGNNCRCSCERSYSIGWKPKYPTNASFFENARAETIRLGKAQAQ